MCTILTLLPYISDLIQYNTDFSRFFDTDTDINFLFTPIKHMTNTDHLTTLECIFNTMLDVANYIISFLRNVT